MTNLLGILVGVLITLIATMNAGLVEYIGMPFALVVLHGGAVIICFLLVLKDKKGLSFKSDLPLYFYTGGAIGFFVTFLNSVCMVKIGASLSVAIVIFGQMLTSCVIDHFGLFKMPVRKFNIQKLGGFLVITVGIVLMYFGN